MAWDIFTTAFASLFGRLGAAIKATILPAILFAAVLGGFIYFGNTMLESQFSAGSSTAMFFIVAFIIIFPFSLFCFSWVAVLWHRAAILDMDPGFIPDFRGINVPAYAGRLVILGLIIIVSLLPLGIIGGIAGSLFGISAISAGVVGLSIAGTILNFLFGIVVTFLWLRISATLPGIALGRSLSIGDGWRETTELVGPIFGVSCLLNLINILISAAILAVASTSLIAVQLIQIPITWFTLMLGMSMMTEIYKRTMHVDAVADVFE